MCRLKCLFWEWDYGLVSCNLISFNILYVSSCFYFDQSLFFHYCVLWGCLNTVFQYFPMYWLFRLFSKDMSLCFGSVEFIIVIYWKCCEVWFMYIQSAWRGYFWGYTVCYYLDEAQKAKENLSCDIPIGEA